MQGGVETIKPYVDEFIRFAKQHREYKFLVTKVGCGIAGFMVDEIAPLFKDTIDVENIILSKDFVEVIQQQPTTDEMKALQMWKMGTGNPAKRFNGEDPIPTKTEVATKDSWKIEPMPEKNVSIPLNVTIPRAAMQIVKCGHIPDAMEDHWFMYCDDSTIRYYRSWKGICIFIAKYVEEGSLCTITELQVNRDSGQYGSKDNDHDVALFMALLTKEYGGDASKYWQKAF